MFSVQSVKSVSKAKISQSCSIKKMKDPGCLLLSSVSIFYLSLIKFNQAEWNKIFALARNVSNYSLNIEWLKIDQYSHVVECDYEVRHIPTYNHLYLHLTASSRPANGYEQQSRPLADFTLPYLAMIWHKLDALLVTYCTRVQVW